MNLVQLGTTASRANREKSVKNSIAQRIVQWDYGSNGRAGEAFNERRRPITTKDAKVYEGNLLWGNSFIYLSTIYVAR